MIKARSDWPHSATTIFNAINFVFVNWFARVLEENTKKTIRKKSRSSDFPPRWLISNSATLCVKEILAIFINIIQGYLFEHFSVFLYNFLYNLNNWGVKFFSLSFSSSRALVFHSICEASIGPFLQLDFAENRKSCGSKAQKHFDPKQTAQTIQKSRICIFG